MAEHYDSKDGCGCPSKETSKLPSTPVSVLTTNTQTKSSKQDKPK